MFVVGSGVRDLVNQSKLPHTEPRLATAEVLQTSLELTRRGMPWNRLPLGALVAMLVGLVARLPWVPSQLGWCLRGAVVALVVAWVLPATVAAEGTPAELRAPLWWLPAFTAVILAGWALLESLAARPPSGSIPLAMMLTALTATGVVLYADLPRAPEAATVLAGALGGLTLVAWWRRVDGGGAVPGVAVLLPGLLFMVHRETYSNVPWVAFALAAGAPLILALTLLPPFRAWQGMRLHLLRFALLLAPLAVAGALAVAHGSEGSLD